LYASNGRPSDAANHLTELRHKAAHSTKLFQASAFGGTPSIERTRRLRHPQLGGQPGAKPIAAAACAAQADRVFELRVPHRARKARRLSLLEHRQADRASRNSESSAFKYSRIDGRWALNVPFGCDASPAVSRLPTTGPSSRHARAALDVRDALERKPGGHGPTISRVLLRPMEYLFPEHLRSPVDEAESHDF